MTAEDAPAPDRLVVTISGVQLVGDASGPIDVTFKEGFEPPYAVDLMALDPDEELVIADASALVDLPDPSTTFDQVRFIVESATVFYGDVESDVTVPSGAQTGLKVNVDPAAGPGDTVTIEFDVARLIETGNGSYNLVPTAVRAFVVDDAPAEEPVVEPIEAE